MLAVSEEELLPQHRQEGERDAVQIEGDAFRVTPDHNSGEAELGPVAHGQAPGETSSPLWRVGRRAVSDASLGALQHLRDR